ncbi:hypothetical protein FACS189437_03750 [Bacteroidia bacterium]|nr:hypothetical protein FACS189437_03750 [Bacteroidia bacterium]
MLREKKKSFWLEFLLPAAISTVFAVIFKWDAGEIVWGFWGASLWLGIIFCFFIVFLVAPYVHVGAGKALGFAMAVLLYVVVYFHMYTGGLINQSGIGGNEYNIDFMNAAAKATKMFFPFIALCVYGEIKSIFFTWLDTWEQFVKFFIVFARLQLIALFCFYFGKDIPDFLLYLTVYSVCFLPIRIFEYDIEEEN